MRIIYVQDPSSCQQPLSSAGPPQVYAHHYPSQECLVIALQAHRLPDFIAIHDALASAVWGDLIRRLNESTRSEGFLQDAFMKELVSTSPVGPRPGTRILLAAEDYPNFSLRRIQLSPVTHQDQPGWARKQGYLAWRPKLGGENCRINFCRPIEEPYYRSALTG